MGRQPDRLTRDGRRPPLALNDPRAVDAALRAAVGQLDAVLAEQEKAATRILGLAELLMAREPDPATRLRIEAIMESCAFQDVAGQRVRRVRGLLSRLTTLKAGALRLTDRPVETPTDTAGAAPEAESISTSQGGLTQADVDRLLGKGGT
ncbi:hypothetical protein [Roseospira navarrensis]|uniref:Chemotaxis protein CheZ n=1 Tax=Roseospira navarrensis TaxID=140058 RepID=A0A7X1ZCM7_9PROT|nr:hypothetical protein [Roseospira navarrensis]MQX36104.1 hypothetical protein [Roseospira navarrensis]